MALQDHFHPPLSSRRHWRAFHNAWATYIASDLNRRLPQGYFAEPNVQFGIEIDVATFEDVQVVALPARSGWQPPPPTRTVPFAPVSETVEIDVFNDEAGPTLVGAIELVSPANKDRPAQRSAFTSKCETYLQQGAGLIVVDIVTVRKANLHDALLQRLAPQSAPRGDSTLYAAAYHPVERDEQASVDIWQESLAIGNSLPTLPLWLRGAFCLPVDLEGTYERTCREQRVHAKGA